MFQDICRNGKGNAWLLSSSVTVRQITNVRVNVATLFVLENDYSLYGYSVLI